MLRRCFIALLLPMLSGCITPNLGEVYATEQHGAAVEDSARVVVYPAADVSSGIVFHLKIGDERVGRVFQETFFSHVVEPGRRDIVAQEYWSGEGFGQDLADAANPLKLFEPVDVSTPESLNVGVATSHALEIGPGQVVFLRLKKAEGKEYFFACEETEDTTTMCSGMRYDTVIEVVDEHEAEQQLLGRRESL